LGDFAVPGGDFPVTNVVRVTVLAAIVALAALLGTATPAGSSPARADLYAAPDPLPRGAPGALIRSERLDAPPGTRLWRVLYHSRAVDGRDVPVSGFVAAPDASTRRRRVVVAFGHGTAGLADACAPSLTASDRVRVSDLSSLIEAGYVVAATDYEGLGSPGLHPYLVGRSEGRGMLDAVRAARRLRGAHAGKRVVTFGHSQGGHASWFAAHEAPGYAPELDVVATVSSAPVIDPVAFVRAATTPATVGFAVMMMKGLDAAYADADASAAFTSLAAEQSTIVDEQCAYEIGTTFARPYGEVFIRNPADDPHLAAFLGRSTLPLGVITAPVLVLQGEEDELLPKSETDAFVQAACAAGTPIDYRVYPGANHNSAYIESRPDFVSWIAERVAGVPDPNTCRPSS
jgi:pimeloyl-ACP methyl ester carboxylesterase